MKTAAFRTKPFRTSPIFWVAMLCLMACLLFATAVMQFRSTAQINEATEDRIGGNLESLMIDWHLDFYRRFSAICVALQVGPDSGAFDDPTVFRDRYTQWRLKSRTPQLVKNLYIWETSQKTSPELLSLDAATGPPRASIPPENFGPLLARLRARSSNLYEGLRAWEMDNPESSTRKAPRLYLTQASDPLSGWQFDQNIPAIVHPIVHHKIPALVDDPSGPDAIDWIIIVLDIRNIQTEIFPALAVNHFGTLSNADYFVAVAALGNPNRFLYDSFGDGEGTKIDQSDAAMNIFGPPPASIEDDFWVAFKNANAVKVQNWRHFSSPIWFPVIHYSNADNPWMLILTHRKGHLENIAANVRYMNLFTNGVILVLLAAGIALVAITAQRAQSYARLQMDFVSSISHELRTPLTAIYSAGENLADGVVVGQSQSQHYGSIITSQARHLIDLVDQILTFASHRNRANPDEMPLVEVGETINIALQNTQPSIRAGGFNIELDIAPGLPLVEGDQAAIVSCIQNLLANAIKYSGKSRCIRVSATLAKEKNDREVQISVEDHGIGIAAAELTDVFKPFYRSHQVRAAQIHGTGLGLSVAKELVESMGGSISVISALGSGTKFTLCLRGSTQGAGQIQSGEESSNE